MLQLVVAPSLSYGRHTNYVLVFSLVLKFICEIKEEVRKRRRRR
jgi:hypothetical protein